MGTLKRIPSGGGAFEVRVNGEKIYSKLATGEFPKPEEVLKVIKGRLS
jgi:selenoprotein W-related protein